MNHTWPSTPLKTLVTVTREVIDPSSLVQQVDHYSIPALEMTGAAAVEDPSTIQSAKLLLLGNELLISRLNPRKARVVAVQSSTRIKLASTEFIPLRPGPSIDRRFLRYLLLAESTRQQLDARVQSVTRSHQRVDPEVVASLRLGVPPMDEQRRVADFLDDQVALLDRATHLRQRQIALWADRFGGWLDDLLVVARLQDSPRRPLAWLTDPQRPIQYGIVLPGPNVEDGVPIIKGGDVAARRLSPATLNKTTVEIEAAYTRSRVYEGDLVISIRGSYGELEYVPASLNGANLTQDAARIAPLPCASG